MKGPATAVNAAALCNAGRAAQAADPSPSGRYSTRGNNLLRGQLPIGMALNRATAGKIVALMNAAEAPGPIWDSTAPPVQASATADFRSIIHPVDKWSLGSTISTFGGSGKANINLSETWLSTLAALGPLAWRIPLRFDGGYPGSSAGGAQTSGDAAGYIFNILRMKGTPYVVVGGNSSDNDMSAHDVEGLVHYFNDNNGARTGAKLERIVIGNEPENGGNSSDYLARLPSLLHAAKVADPTVLCSAPAASYWDPALIGQAATLDDVDILSYHAYDGANADGTGFPNTSQYQQHMLDMKKMGNFLVGCEEVNWHFDDSVEGLLDSRNTCFLASVFGQVISGGGHVHHYADSAGALGLLNDGNTSLPGKIGDPLPAYWALAMWTGLNGQFRRAAGWTVPTVCSISDVDLFATSNGKIVMVNKTANSHDIEVGIGGRPDGNYTAWQTSASAPLRRPRLVADSNVFHESLIPIHLSAGTVTSLEIN